MSPLTLDPTILNDFRAESNQLLEELKNVVNGFETEQATFPDALLTQFAQKIDRIMGAAQTMNMLAPEHIGLKSIGKLAELCKSIGYKAAETKDLALIPFSGPSSWTRSKSSTSFSRISRMST